MISDRRAAIAFAAACLAATQSPAAAADVHLTNRADRYVTKFGDWNVYAKAGNDAIRDSGLLKEENNYEHRALFGEGGDDALRGTFLHGGTGNDRLTVISCDEDNGCDARGDVGNDVLTADFRGSMCNNELTLHGGPGNDKLTVIMGAGSGYCDTRLTGGAGRDVSVGSPGSFDRFVFFGGQSPRGPDHDIVRGFARGQDAIDLSGGDANLLRAGVQRYAWGGRGPNPGVGQVSWYRVGADTFFVANNGHSLLEVELDNLNAPLAAIDFRL